MEMQITCIVEIVAGLATIKGMLSVYIYIILIGGTIAGLNMGGWHHCSPAQQKNTVQFVSSRVNS